MRHYTIAEFDELGDDVETTLSEEQILKEYWDYWYGNMCKKFGKEFVDENYGPEECLQDWIIIHWAWETDSSGNILAL